MDEKEKIRTKKRISTFTQKNTETHGNTQIHIGTHRITQRHTETNENSQKHIETHTKKIGPSNRFSTSTIKNLHNKPQTLQTRHKISIIFVKV